jgi:hypothetical protein
MKKLNTILVIAAVAAVGCAKTEVVNTPDVKIGYQVASYSTQTKADDGGFLKEMETFSITAANALFKSVAFINADDGNGGQAAPARFYAAATDQVETIKYASNQWAPVGADYYWPKSPNSDIDFFSWFDLTETASTHVANATYASSTYTLAWTDDRTIGLKDNVMYADPVWKQKKNKKAPEYGHDGVSEGVPTLFHHALAQVRFQFKQETMSAVDSKDNTKSTFWVVKVKNLTIANNQIKKAGTLSLTAAKNAASWTTPSNLIWGDAATDAYWSTSDLFLANAVSSTGIELTNTADTFSKDDQMPDEYITVLPQQIGNGLLLNFDIEIETKFGATSGGASGATHVSTETIHVKDFESGGALVKNSGIQLNLLTTIGSYWQMNKKYTYVFSIDPATTKILYDPAVEDWASDVSQTQVIPQPTV